MRVVICADAHLDSVFSVFKKNPAKLQTRRDEQKLAFSKAVNEASKTGAHLLILPGDILDARNASSETLDFLTEAFRSIPETFVLITPGNHDPAVPDSPYLTHTWPENVYIFSKGLEALELAYEEMGEKVRIYGAGFNGHFCRSSLLRVNNTLPVLDKSNLNLLVMHGNITDAGGRSDYNPIYVDDINTCGFDFCILGHVHKYSGIINTGSTSYVYPGTCEGRGFDETGACGILSGTISKDSVKLDFIPTSIRENHTVDIDITGLESYEQVENAIRAGCPNPEWLYKVTLTGTRHPDIYFSLNKLSSELSEEYFYIKIIAGYNDYIDAHLLKDENSLRGCFVRCMLERIETAPDEDKETYQRALAYGLKAFDGEVQF